MKKCYKCGVVKNIGEFYKNKSKKDGLDNRCKECSRKHHRGYQAKNGDAHSGYQRKWKYGLSEEILQLLIKNEIPCMTCGSKENVCVDHCHETGIIRGFLCRNCNISLGMMKENSNNIERLAKYAKMCEIQKELG